MNKEKAKDITKIYNSLSHPLRKRIIELIGKKQFVGFKDLKDNFNVSVGTIYYHLDMLGDLISQNKEKKYVLTDKGRSALGFLRSNEEKLKKPFMDEKKSSFLSSFINEVFFGKRLFTLLVSNSLRFLPEVIIFMIFGAWIFSQNNIEPIMLFYNNQPIWSSSLIIMLEFFLSWIAVFAISEILCLLFFRRKGGELSLLVTSAFCFLPILIIPIFIYFVNLLNLSFSIDWFWVNVFLLGFQAWFLTLLTSALGFSKGIKLEKGAIISLIILYFNITILLLMVRVL